MWYLYCNYIINGQNSGLVDILPKCNNLSWNSDGETLATSLIFDSLYDLAEGRTHIILKKDSKVVFTGVIVNKTNKDLSSSYTAMDYGFYLNQNKLIIQFNNVNAKQAIQQLCSKFNIKTSITALNTKIKQIYKDKSISDIIKDILEQCKNEIGEDYIFEMQGDILYINKLNDLKVDCKILIGKDYSVTRSIEDRKTRIIVVSNQENSTRILADISDKESISVHGQLTEIISVEDKDIAQAKNIAKNNLVLLNRTKRELSIQAAAIENGENIKAKRMIYINIAKYDAVGWYKIKNANHNLSNNIHKIDLTIDFS